MPRRVHACSSILETLYLWHANLMSGCGHVQVSFSGQAVVFVVRTIKWSPLAVAGRLTYIAFFAAQARFQISA